MNRRSNVVPVVALAAGLLALVVAVVVALIPFAHAGSAAPTAAFVAQHKLDAVAFRLGTSPGARYSGTLTVTPKSGAAVTVSFTDLVVTGTKNAEGTIKVNDSSADYRQIGNYRFVKGPSKLFADLLGDRENIDIKPTDNTWSDTSYSGLPELGYLLNPTWLAGQIGNTERVKAPEPGLELPSPNKGLPDARFWPTSDPAITSLGDNEVQVGDMQTTFDPTAKTVTHVKGKFGYEGGTVDIDTDVTPVAADDLSSLFSAERSLVPSLLSTPAPGIPLVANRVRTGPGGGCTVVACGFVTSVDGSLDPDAAPGLPGFAGHVNFGLTTVFAVDNAPAGSSGGTCTRVVTVPIGGKGTAQCTATNLPQGDTVKPTTTYQYLPFRELGADDLNNYIGEQEKSSKAAFTMVRTGSKKPDAASYNDQVTGMPSSYGVEVGDYLFDGVGPAGNLFVVFSPGYDDHLSAGGGFDQSWSGLAQLTDQMRKQVAAAGDRQVTYVATDDKVATALRLLAAAQNVSSDKLVVFTQAPASN